MCTCTCTQAVVYFLSTRGAKSSTHPVPASRGSARECIAPTPAPTPLASPEEAEEEEEEGEEEEAEEEASASSISCTKRAASNKAL